MGKKIIKYGVSTVISSKGRDLTPSFLYVGGKIYRIKNWQECFKIILYYNYVILNKQEFIDSIVNKVSDKFKVIVIADKNHINSTYVKFSKELFVKVYSSSSHNSIQLLYELKRNIGLDFALLMDEEIDEEYVCDYDDELKNEINELKGKYNLRRIQLVSCKYFISRINSEILSDEEKMFLRVEKEFNEKILIGDIILNKNEEEILWKYMKGQIEQVILKGRISTFHDKVFAYGLVVFAREYYDKGFWNHLNEVFNVSLTGAQQSIINNTFKEIMINNKKYYDSNSQFYIQNICMHSFVTDKCAPQLFNYIFEFWRIDLSKNIENMYDQNGNNIFESLIDDIKKNGDIGIQDIMIHTTMALNENSRSCKIRVRNILKMIDKAYWDNFDYSNSQNRMAKLFAEWTKDKKSLFAKEYNKTIKERKHERREKALYEPIISYDGEENFFIILPKQKIKGIVVGESVVWKIDCKEQKYDIECKPILGKTGWFITEKIVPFSKDCLFEEIEIELVSKENDKQISKYLFDKNNVRFFNLLGKMINTAKNNLPIGKVTCFTNSEEIDFVTRKVKYELSIEQSYKKYVFELKPGDVISSSEGNLYHSGKLISNGIANVEPINNIQIEWNKRNYCVYNTQPMVFINDFDNDVKHIRIKILYYNNTIVNDFIIDKDYRKYSSVENEINTSGIFIDVSEYCNNDGIYNVEIKAKKQKPLFFSYCLLRDFSYSFENAPYFYCETGRLVLNNFNVIDKYNDWIIKNNCCLLDFNLSEIVNKEENRHVSGTKLAVHGYAANEQIKAMIDIPALYWKYSLDEKWEHLMINDVSAKYVPLTLLFDGALQFNKAIIRIDDDSLSDESETKIYFNAEKNCYVAQMKDIMNLVYANNEDKKVVLLIDGLKIPLFGIKCKNVVNEATIIADVVNNKMVCSFDIDGPNNCYADLSFAGQKIAEKISLTNGKFEIPLKGQNGEYSINVYELIEDETGINSYYNLIKALRKKVMRLDKLSGANLKIEKLVSERRGSKGILKLRRKYTIKNLTIINDCTEEILNKYDIHTWTIEPTEENVSNSYAYFGSLFEENGTKSGKLISHILLLFTDRNTLKSNIILRKDEDEYFELLYDNEKKTLVSDEKQYNNKLNKSYLTILFDDEYQFSLSIDSGGE